MYMRQTVCQGYDKLSPICTYMTHFATICLMLAKLQMTSSIANDGGVRLETLLAHLLAHLLIADEPM